MSECNVSVLKSMMLPIPLVSVLDIAARVGEG
jgi:hypothetical protein